MEGVMEWAYKSSFARQKRSREKKSQIKPTGESEERDTRSLRCSIVSSRTRGWRANMLYPVSWMPCLPT